jgi:hypothetical protein
VAIPTRNKTTGASIAEILAPLKRNQTAFLDELKNVFVSGDPALWPEFGPCTVPSDFNVVMVSNGASVVQALTPSPTPYPTLYPTPYPTPSPMPYSPWTNDDDNSPGYPAAAASTASNYVLTPFSQAFALVWFIVLSCRVRMLERKVQLLAAAGIPATDVVAMGRTVSAGTAAEFLASTNENAAGTDSSGTCRNHPYRSMETKGSAVTVM